MDKRRDGLSYRPCVGVMVLNRDGRAFVGRRNDVTNAIPERFLWQMPQGGIDPGEAPWDAAVRELHEETSICSIERLAEASDWFSYDFPDDVLEKGFKGRYRGQTQKWFAVRFTGHDSEINIAEPGGGGHKAEFDAWRWNRMEALPDLIVPFKRRVYEHIVAEFRHLAG